MNPLLFTSKVIQLIYKTAVRNSAAIFHASTSYRKEEIPHMGNEEVKTQSEI